MVRRGIKLEGRVQLRDRAFARYVDEFSYAAGARNESGHVHKRSASGNCDVGRSERLDHDAFEERNSRPGELEFVLIERRGEERAIDAQEHEVSGSDVTREHALGEDVPLLGLKVESNNVELRHVEAAT